MNFRSKVRSRATAVLDVTPLIDIVFLLLIFFLITTTFVRRQEMVVTINLPEGTTEAPAVDNEELTIFLQPDGTFTVTNNAEPERALTLDQSALQNELQTLYETDPDISVFLRGDRDVNYGSVIDLLLLTREIGFRRVQAVIRDAQGFSP